MISTVFRKKRWWQGNRMLCVGLPYLLTGLLSPLLKSSEVEALPYIDQGWAALESGNADQAAVAFEQALTLHPESAEVVCYLGVAEFQRKQYERALDLLERAGLANPDIEDSAYLFYKASCFRALGLLQQEKQTWEAVQAYDARSEFASVATRMLASRGGNPSRTSASYQEQGRRYRMNYPYLANACFVESYLVSKGPREENAALQLIALTLIENDEQDTVLNMNESLAARGAKSPVWNMLMAMAHMKREEWQKALALLEPVLNHPEVGTRARELASGCHANATDLETASAVIHPDFKTTPTGMESETFRSTLQDLKTLMNRNTLTRGADR